MTLNFKSFGQGEPVILLHGLFGMLDNWQSIAKRLAENYLVFIVDQRNHGRSPHSDEMNYALMAEDLKTFMESQWIYEAHLLGHSMGGKTVMQFALDYPEMVDKLVVVDIAPKYYPPGHLDIFEALFSVDLTTIENRKQVDKILEKKISELGIRQFLLKNLNRDKDNTFKWKMNLPAIYKNYEQVLKGLDQDTTFPGDSLFIKGGNSNYITLEDKIAIKTQFPGSKFIEITGAGHWVHAEAPTPLLKELFLFLG